MKFPQGLQSYKLLQQQKDIHNASIIPNYFSSAENIIKIYLSKQCVKLVTCMILHSVAKSDAFQVD